MGDILRQFAGTIYEKGYGMLSKFVMRDTKLKVGSKALYGYLITYGNESAFPSRDLICHDLSINEKTFTTYLQELKKRGYVRVEQVKEEGRFSHNIYYIEHDITKLESLHKELAEQEGIEEQSPHTKKRNTAHRDPKNGTPKNGTPKNGALIKQTLNSTSFNNTTTNKSAVVASQDSLEDNEAIREMLKVGVSKKVAVRLYQEKGQAVIEKKLAVLEKNKDSIKKRAGWLVKAIEEDYSDMDEEIEAQEKAKAKERAEAISKAAEESLKAQMEQAPVAEIDPSSPFARMAARLGMLKSV